MAVYNLTEPDGAGWERLVQLGLTIEQLDRVITRALGAYRSTTRFHPRSAQGLELWLEGTAALRQVTAGQRDSDWDFDEQDSQPRTFNNRTGTVIVVSTGDDFTGLLNASPTTRNTKGMASAKKVGVNADQLSLFGDEPLEDLPGGLTWWLLLAVHDGALYGELSLPGAMSDDCRPTAWRERLILEPLQLNGSPTPVVESDEVAAEIDIDVQLR